MTGELRDRLIEAGARALNEHMVTKGASFKTPDLAAAVVDALQIEAMPDDDTVEFTDRGVVLVPLFRIRAAENPE